MAALGRYLAGLGVECWTKPDRSALGMVVHEVTRRRFPGFERAIEPDGPQLYCIALVPSDEARRDLARR